MLPERDSPTTGTPRSVAVAAAHLRRLLGVPIPEPARSSRPMSRHVSAQVPLRALVLGVVVVSVLGVVVALGQPHGSAPGSPSEDDVSELLDRVAVVSQRPSVPGYERDCTGASACVFGPAWTDATTAPGGGNGCSTREDVLARDIRAAPADTSSADTALADGASSDTVAVTRDAGTTTRCATPNGVLADPYSGRVVDVARSGTRAIHIDHVYPLKAAWDLGAWRWTPDRRARFANDTDANLLAVTGTVNTGKSDSTPADWLPPDPARHCFYAARYLTAAITYGLPVTADDHDALSDAIRRCPG